MQKYKKPIVIVMVLAVISALFLAVFPASDTGSSSPTSETTAPSPRLSAEVATYELLTGSPDRLLVGLFTSQGTVSYEPWVFLVGSDGTIIDRWQNVLDRPQLEAELQKLLARPAH